MKKALGINAIFSGTSGIILILFQSQFSKIFAIEARTPFWAVGTALIYFSLTILYEMKSRNRNRILWIIIQDLLWVCGSVYILMARPFSISQMGNYLIGAVAIVVLFMAVSQFSAWKKAFS